MFSLLGEWDLMNAVLMNSKCLFWMWMQLLWHLVCVPLDKDALYKLKSEPVLIQFVLRELNFVALEYSLRKMMFKSLKKCFVYITDCALTPSLSWISLRISLSARSNVYVRGRCCPLPVFSSPNVEKTCLQGWISSSICRCHCQTSLMKSSSRNTTSVSCCSTHSLFSHTIPSLRSTLQLTGQPFTRPRLIHEVVTLYWSGFDLHLKDVCMLEFYRWWGDTAVKVIFWMSCVSRPNPDYKRTCEHILHFWLSVVRWMNSWERTALENHVSLPDDVKAFIHWVLQCHTAAADDTF